MRRRILLNFRVEAEVAARQLPSPFRPRLHHGWALAGVCLLRLEEMRPAFLPASMGMSSENALHRFAVEWEEKGETHHGLFVARRDTNSPLAVITRGRLLPGDPHLASFKIRSGTREVEVEIHAQYGEMDLVFSGSLQRQWPKDSCFGSVEAASRFFEAERLGYSTRRGAAGLEGFQWTTREWDVQALTVQEISASYFDDLARFPQGSTHFDHALMLQNVQHEWAVAPQLACECAAA